MNINDPRYDNQGLHVVLAMFTIENGKFKVLLIKRKNEPFKNKWILVGGCAYNTETGEEAMKRELYEKTRLKDLEFEMFDVFTNPNRSPQNRMIAIGYIGVSDCSIIEKFSKTEKASDANWFEIDKIPELGYDHKEILYKAIEVLKQKIFTTSIMKRLFPDNFTMPELQSAYEIILNKSLDRRNFRKKLLADNIIIETGKLLKVANKKATKLYKFNSINKQINLYI